MSWNIAGEELVKEYGDILFRIGIVMLKNRMDAEDAAEHFHKIHRKKAGNSKR